MAPATNPTFATSQDQVRRVLMASLAVGFAALLLAVMAAALLTKRSQEHSNSVTHTYEVEGAIAALRIPIWRSEAARRGYLITPNPAVLAVYRETASAIAPALDRVTKLTADNPRQRPRIARLRALLASLTRIRQASIDAVTTATISEATRAESIDASVPILIETSRVAQAMVAEEQRLLAIRARSEQQSLDAFYIALAIATVLLIFVGVLTAITLMRYTRDLSASRDRLRDLADSLEDTVQERTADLSRANEEIQRFAYIVSHDLRSPLVNVLGFTSELEAATKTLSQFVDQIDESAPQLVSAEARVAAREDLPEAIGFIRSSTRKMDRLINAILKLSREGRRVVAPEPLDIGAMVADIRATLQHRIDEIDAQIVIDGTLPAIVSDKLAIEQILSNLIENAVKYLDPARPGRITVAGHRSGETVVLTVADNGRGIDPRDHQRIFDLFRRSGAQDQPGEGIGLAHVRALTYRLGGRIEVDSQLGQGAVFRLMLPRTFTEARTSAP